MKLSLVILEDKVNGKEMPAHPQFFSRGQGKSPPRLHKALVEVTRAKAVVILRPTLPFQLMVPNSEAVGPMKPLQGSTPVAAQMEPIPVKGSPVDLDTGERVGEMSAAGKDAMKQL